METLYRKVKISERLPEKDGNYYTEQGLITFEKGTFWQCEGRVFVKSNSNITNYLEPIPNPTSKLQAEKAELLEALRKVQNELSQFKESFGQGSELIPEIESLIQKHKQ